MTTRPRMPTLSGLPAVLDPASARAILTAFGDRPIHFRSAGSLMSVSITVTPRSHWLNALLATLDACDRHVKNEKDLSRILALHEAGVFRAL